MFRYVRLSTLPLLTLTYQFSVLSMNVWVRATGTIVIRRILNTRKGLKVTQAWPGAPLLNSWVIRYQSSFSGEITLELVEHLGHRLGPEDC